MEQIVIGIVVIMAILIVIKTGSLGKGLGFFFRFLFRYFLWGCILLVVGFLVAGKTGAIVGAIIGLILSLFKSKKQYDDNYKQ